MSVDPSYPTQVAIAAQLLAASAVTAIVGANVLDPSSATNAPYPNVLIDQIQIIGKDTDFGPQSDVHVTLLLQADGPAGGLTCALLFDAVRAALETPPVLIGHTVSSWAFVTSVPHRVRDDTDATLIAQNRAMWSFRSSPNPGA